MTLMRSGAAQQQETTARYHGMLLQDPPQPLPMQQHLLHKASESGLCQGGHSHFDLGELDVAAAASSRHVTPSAPSESDPLNKTDDDGASGGNGGIPAMQQHRRP